MRFFLKQCLRFAFLPIVLILIGTLAVRLSSKRMDYSLPNNITTIYIGDSHMQYAVNDSLLTNSKNVAMSGESFYHSYFKLIKIFQYNPQVKRVYLGFGYHSISAYYDAYISGVFARSIAPAYFNALPMREQLKTIWWSRKNLPAFYGNLLEAEYDYYLHHSSFYPDRYYNQFTNPVASDSAMQHRAAWQFHNGAERYDFSKLHLFYLRQIIQLCRSKAVTLIAMNTPLHPHYRSLIPPTYVTEYQAIIQQYGLQLQDYTTLSLSDSCYTPDGDHLSSKGAELFVHQFLMDIKR